MAKYRDANEKHQQLLFDALVKDAAAAATTEDSPTGGKASELYGESGQETESKAVLNLPPDYISPSTRARAAEVREGVLKRQFDHKPSPAGREKAAATAWEQLGLRY